MSRLILILKSLVSNQRGATAVEYGLIIAFVVLAMFGALETVGSSTSSMWNNVSTKVAEAR